MRVGVLLIGALLVVAPMAAAQQPVAPKAASPQLVGPFLVRDLLKLLEKDLAARVQNAAEMDRVFQDWLES